MADLPCRLALRRHLWLGNCTPSLGYHLLTADWTPWPSSLYHSMGKYHIVPPSLGKTFFASTGIFYHSGVGDTCKKEPEESQGAWTNGAAIPHLAGGNRRRTPLPSPLPTPWTTTSPCHPFTQGWNTGRGTCTKYSPPASHAPGEALRSRLWHPAHLLLPYFLKWLIKILFQQFLTFLS